MSIYTYTLVKIDEPHPRAGETYWQVTDGNDEDSLLLGIVDDDGEQVCLGNATWTAINSELVPPFL